MEGAQLVVPRDLSAAMSSRIGTLMRWLKRNQGPKMIFLKSEVTWSDRELGVILDCYNGGCGGMIMLEAPQNATLRPEEPLALVLSLLAENAEVWLGTLGNLSFCVGFHVKITENEPKEDTLPEGWQE